jgi:diguanylate cyclase (GGDEF)-like protein
MTSTELPNIKVILPTLLSLFVLTLLAFYSYYWNINNINGEKINLALAEARANWNKDAAIRKWATMHGGLYVKPDERTPPNPSLAHLPHRDIVTTKGVKLTLMNPAYMMSQMAEEYSQLYGIKGKITGKIQLNPKNKPDDWQFKALTLFELGDINELYEQQLIDGKPYLRYMKPMYMTEGCVACHGHLGFRVGDLRGGVSVSIPLTPYFTAASLTNKRIQITHIIIWIVGVIAIFIFFSLIKKLLSEMSHRVLHDELTHLPNLTLFKNRLNQAVKKYKRESNNKFAVVFLDLDNFKHLNDSHGHSVGDQLLITLAERLKKTLRPGDTVARIGGDEFTFILNDLEDLIEAVNVSKRIFHSFTKPFIIENEEIYSNGSIGICMVSEVTHSTDEMIRNADIAMYRAKLLGSGNIKVFNPEMHKNAIETMQLENEMQTALEKNQFSIHYQPVINIDKNQIDGFEALLRWKHPTLGYISPERFIPIAEKSGLIRSIGKWVLESAIEQTQQWSKEFLSDRVFNIAVNLSGVQIINENLVSQISEALERSQMSADNLHLEVTETMLVEKKEQAKCVMTKIRKLGASLSIDDFGKGYCSLTYLQEFDFDILKIDKDFVQDLENDKGLQLVRALMMLAKDFNMKVVAEGVETEKQLLLLKEMGRPYIQGYYFSRPLSVDDMGLMLKKKLHLDAYKLLSI